MQLEFSKDSNWTPSDDLKGILRLAFDSVQRQLGLDTEPEGVIVKFAKTCDGDACTDTMLRPFLITMTEFNPFRMIVNLAHEMIHVKDLASGKLKLIWNNGMPRMSYNGIPVPDMVLASARVSNSDMHALPFEREAYTRMGGLAKQAIAEMPHSAVDYIIRHSQEDLRGRSYQEAIDRADAAFKTRQEKWDNALRVLLKDPLIKKTCTT